MCKKEIPDHQKKRIEQISLFIKNWRLNEGLSQHQFGRIAETHTNTIHNLEAHPKNISILTILNCIDAMDGMTLSEFFADME